MKILLHIEQLLNPLPVYHVAVQCGQKRYDFHPRNVNIPRFLVSRMKRCPRKIIHIGNTDKTINEIDNFVNLHCNKDYMFPVYDCRHYTQSVIMYVTNKDINLTDPIFLHDLFHN